MSDICRFDKKNSGSQREREDEQEEAQFRLMKTIESTNDSGKRTTE